MYIYKKSKIINKLSEYGRATKLRDIITIYIYIYHSIKDQLKIITLKILLRK